MIDSCEAWLKDVEENEEVKLKINDLLEIKDNQSFYGGGIRIS